MSFAVNVNVILYMTCIIADK